MGKFIGYAIMATGIICGIGVLASVLPEAFELLSRERGYVFDIYDGLAHIVGGFAGAIIVAGLIGSIGYGMINDKQS